MLKYWSELDTGREEQPRRVVSVMGFCELPLDFSAREERAGSEETKLQTRQTLTASNLAVSRSCCPGGFTSSD